MSIKIQLLFVVAVFSLSTSAQNVVNVRDTILYNDTLFLRNQLMEYPEQITMIMDGLQKNKRENVIESAYKILNIHETLFEDLNAAAMKYEMNLLVDLIKKRVNIIYDSCGIRRAELKKNKFDVLEEEKDYAVIIETGSANNVNADDNQNNDNLTNTKNSIPNPENANPNKVVSPSTSSKLKSNKNELNKTQHVQKIILNEGEKKWLNNYQKNIDLYQKNLKIQLKNKNSDHIKKTIEKLLNHISEEGLILSTYI